MLTHASARTLTIAAAGVLATSIGVRAEKHPIDAELSTLTVLVYKSGLFSAFADNHVIRAPIAAGFVSTEGDLAAETTVNSAELTVVDPTLAADKRVEVAGRMHSAEVLDSARYPEIRFTSTDIRTDGTDRWQMTGVLVLHGVSRSVTVAVILQNGHYRGSVPIRQRDFGIQPISIAGGTVKVKDEVRIDFDIVAR